MKCQRDEDHSVKCRLDEEGQRVMSRRHEEDHSVKCWHDEAHMKWRCDEDHSVKCRHDEEDHSEVPA